MRLTKREGPKSEGNGPSNYLKVGDGQKVSGVFRGECHEFWQVWPQGGQKQVFADPTPGASNRFKANFVVHEDGKFVAKVFEFGLTFYNQLAEIGENYDLETTKIQISRRGLGKATQWMVLPLGPVDKKALPLIEATPLNILNGGQLSESAPKNNEEGLPF